MSFRMDSISNNPNLKRLTNLDEDLGLSEPSPDNLQPKNQSDIQATNNNDFSSPPHPLYVEQGQSLNSLTSEFANARPVRQNSPLRPLITGSKPPIPAASQLRPPITGSSNFNRQKAMQEVFDIQNQTFWNN